MLRASIVKSQRPFKKGPVIINLELAKRNTASNQTGPIADLIVLHWQGAVWRSRIMHFVQYEQEKVSWKT